MLFGLIHCDKQLPEWLYQIPRCFITSGEVQIVQVKCICKQNIEKDVFYGILWIDIVQTGDAYTLHTTAYWVLFSQCKFSLWEDFEWSQGIREIISSSVNFESCLINLSTLYLMMVWLRHMQTQCIAVMS